MPGVGAILQGIFRSRGLRPPTAPDQEGAPLFAYRLEPAEQRELERALREQLAAFDLDTTLAAGFCLYGAATICAEYAGGPWAWDIILQRLQWCPSEAELQRAARLGLQFWRRPLVQLANTRYLGTLVCEGGLPLALLRDGRDRALKVFFRELIRDVERFRLPCDDLIDRRVHALPASLQNETVMRLSARLVDAVVAVRREIPFGVVPADYVDQNLENLGRRLPLRLDNAVLLELLKGLVAVPASRAADRALVIELRTALRTDGVVRFERVALAPPSVSLETLGAVLGLERAVLRDNPRIHLELLTVDGARRPVAVARLRSDEQTFTLDRSLARPVVRMPALAGRILLSATVGGKQLALVEPPGGAALDLEAPWALDAAPDRDVHPVLAFGSHRTAATQLLVAVPPDFTVLSENGTTVHA